MKKVFEEYGGVITTCIAIVAIIGVVGLMFTGTGSGWMENAFATVKDNFLNKASSAIDDLEVGGSGSGAADEGLVVEGVVPAGATYMSAATGTTLTEGQALPDAPTIGDIYTQGDYEYAFNQEWNFSWFDNEAQNGWGVRCVNDVAQPGEIVSSINGQPVTSLRNTFQYSANLTTAPEIPKSITCLNNTFEGCGKLLNAPTIPENVTSMNCTFKDCFALVSGPSVIPASVTSLSSAFSWCEKVTGEIEFCGNPSNVFGCFQMTQLSIHITGSASDETKAALAATANNGNVTY